MIMSLVQPPELLADGAPNPRAPEVWLAFGIFKTWVPDGDLVGLYQFLGISGPSRLTQVWFDNLVPVGQLPAGVLEPHTLADHAALAALPTRPNIGTLTINGTFTGQANP